MQDRILIENLHIDTFIGVYDWEAVVRQVLVLDLELVLAAEGVRAAATGDDLASSVDYTSVCGRIVAYASAHRFKLVETFAERLVTTLLEEFPLSGARIRVRKPSALGQAALIGVCIERTKS